MSGNRSSEMTPKAQMVTETDKLNFITIKNVGTSQDNQEDSEDSPQSNRTSANQTRNKGPVPIGLRKTRITHLKMGEDRHRRFSKEDKQMASKQMKWCSASPATRDVQIKTTARYMPHLLGRLGSKKTVTSANNNVEKVGPSDVAGGCEMVQPLWKTVWQFFPKS